LDDPDAWHHVMNRVRRGDGSFYFDKADYQQFFDLFRYLA
jgi:hypothetical protein